jgi:hypothetical protein
MNYTSYNDEQHEQYTERIHEFLDGTLAVEHESALFAALNNSPELRSMMKDMLAIMLTVRQHSPQFAPSPNTTNALFERLGFAVPAGHAAEAAPVAVAAAGKIAQMPAAGLTTTGVGARLALFLTTYRQGIVSALTAATIAALATAIWFLWNDASAWRQYQGYQAYQAAQAGAAMRNSSLNGTPLTPSNGLAYRSHAQFESRLASADTVHERVIIREIVRYVHDAPTTTHAPDTQAQQASSSYASSIQPNVTQPNVTQPNTPQKQPFAHASNGNGGNDNVSNMQLAQQAQQVHPVPPLEQAAASSSQQVSSPSLTPTEREWWSGLRAEVRGTLSQSLPKATVPSNGNPFLNNVAVSLLYSLNEHESVGIEAGQEAIFQQYRSFIEGVPYIVEQNPTLPWIGAAYRYTFTPERAFSPFIHAFGGAHTTGAVGRMMLGVGFSPDTRTQFTFGVEGSAFLYGHQGVYYATPKIGLSYGVAIKF